MAESNQHLRLVRSILTYVRQEFGEIEALALFDDTAEPVRGEKPPLVNGHVPDVYATDSPPSITIIGEAKTQRDLETDRSREQIGCFLDHLAVRPNGVFILAVPLAAGATARGMMKRLLGERPSVSVRVVVLDGLAPAGGWPPC